MSLLQQKLQLCCLIETLHAYLTHTYNFSLCSVKRCRTRTCHVAAATEALTSLLMETLHAYITHTHTQFHNVLSNFAGHGHVVSPLQQEL